MPSKKTVLDRLQAIHESDIQHLEKSVKEGPLDSTDAKKLSDYIKLAVILQKNRDEQLEAEKANERFRIDYEAALAKQAAKETARKAADKLLTEPAPDDVTLENDEFPVWEPE